MDILICPACGAVNRPEARFCWSCGAAQGTACPRCGTANRRTAQFCARCGAGLVTAPVAPAAAVESSAPVDRIAPAVAQPSALLRLLDAHTYPGFGRSQDRPAGQPVQRFDPTDTAFHIRLRLANFNPMHTHSHRLFVQFFRPNGRLHLSRERPELVVAPAGQPEVVTSIFGLRISGTEVVNYPGTWRAVVYLDEERLTEICFEIAA